MLNYYKLFFLIAYFQLLKFIISNNLFNFAANKYKVLNFRK